jgi:lipopolysaccharide biosynthesis glycosyltransferase
MPTLHVACAAEGAYDAHSAAMLRSAALNRGGSEIHFHYLHGATFPRRSAALLAEMSHRLGAEITFHAIAPERVAGLPVVDLFTAAMWYRIFLPELLPETDRVLYLDVDTIVVDSLEPLWAIDLRGHYLGAVTNVFQRNHLHRPAALGLAGPEVYFNSGVLLLNLEEMRRDGCTAALYEYAAARGDALAWPDQDALNVVLGGRRLALHPRWNVMNSLDFAWSGEVFGPEALEEARRRPAIRHFEGPGENKPWNAGCAREGRELYLEHRRHTPWPRVRLERSPRRPGLGRIVRSLGGRVRRPLRRP